MQYAVANLTAIFLLPQCHRVFATTIKRYVELVRQNVSTLSPFMTKFY